MLLNELIDAFKADYEFECVKRGIPQIRLVSKYLALMFSKVVSDLQKKLGVIEASTLVTTSDGTAAYPISASFMTPKVVSVNGLPLEKVSVDWIERQYPANGTPTSYAIQNTGAQAAILFYPTPDAGGITVTVTSNYNFNLYSPSGATTQDFGSFDGTSFSGSTIFPTQYDKVMLLGMMKQIFKDVEDDFNKEVELLKVLQYNGEKFEYHYDDGIDEGAEGLSLLSTPGAVEIDMDLPWKELRINCTYGQQPQVKYMKGWNAGISATDDGTNITIVSAGNEFSDFTQIVPSNLGINFSLQNNNTIVLDSGANYGSFVLTVKVWDGIPVTAQPVTPVIPSATPKKQVRIEAVYGQQPQVLGSNFYHPITAVDNGTNIVITSTGGEFADTTVVILNQAGINYSRPSTSEIDVAAGVNYGTLTILIWEF